MTFRHTCSSNTKWLTWWLLVSSQKVFQCMCVLTSAWKAYVMRVFKRSLDAFASEANTHHHECVCVKLFNRWMKPIFSHLKPTFICFNYFSLHTHTWLNLVDFELLLLLHQPNELVTVTFHPSFVLVCFSSSVSWLSSLWKLHRLWHIWMMNIGSYRLILSQFLFNYVWHTYSKLWWFTSIYDRLLLCDFILFDDFMITLWKWL